MKQKPSETKPGRLAKALRIGAAGLTVVGASAAMSAGCLDRPVVEAQPRTTNVFVDRVRQTAIDKIDLLFVIDNSVSMADKQEILADAVPQLLERLVNPICVSTTDPNQTEEGPGAEVDCPEGFEKEFNAVGDIHIGVVSSSLGGFGGTFCSEQGSDWNPTQNDQGHLVGTRREPELQAQTWNNSGFLAWDLDQEKDPPGDADAETLKTKFTNMVTKVGESGCGFEATLESWYRFLVEPSPPTQVGIENNRTVVSGQDDVLLAQRAQFLRPDSLVAIIMLTDENDCSVRLSGSGWAVATSEINGRAFRMPRATSACATDPNSECCRPCGVSTAPEGCATDAEDEQCQQGNNLAENEDALNLRCYDQKRRFGFSLLHPTSRYVTALRSNAIRNRDGEEVPNPLLAAPGEPFRDPSLVFLAGIVGVPWQDIATEESLTGEGLDYLTWEQLTSEGRWSTILGTPATEEEPATPPEDPLMRETPDIREGANPITGDAIVTSAMPLQNNINGHDYDTGATPNDLQYACIFPLQEPRDCSTEPIPRGCDCDARSGNTDSPLCYDPANPDAGAQLTQYSAKAYPGLRHLEVLRDFGANSIVASICPKVIAGNPTSPSFGYNPAVGAIVDRLKQVLEGRCLPRELTPNETTGEVPCSVIEATVGEACDCASRPGRTGEALDPDTEAAIRGQLESADFCGSPTTPSCSDFCLCEISQLADDEPGTTACLTEQDPASDVAGYCYVDPAQGFGDSKLVENCDPTQKRLLRFVGEELPADGAVTFIACAGSTQRGDGTPADPGGGGSGG